MTLATVQQVLAQLYTNTDYRKDFFANPQIIGNKLGLNCEEIEQLSQLSSQQVNLFASSLKRKRLGEIHRFLPLTKQVLDRNFSQLFWRYAETYLPQGIKKHWQDALHFASFMEQVAESEGIDPPWVLDVLRYETAWLQTAEPSHRFICCRFNYEIAPLVESVKQDLTTVLLRKPTIGIWFRLSRKAQLRHFIFSAL